MPERCLRTIVCVLFVASKLKSKVESSERTNDEKTQTYKVERIVVDDKHRHVVLLLKGFADLVQRIDLDGD